ncbi:MAG TPA: hypothetical protein VGD69_13800 [Herpetosiphonaceae bacterium]
MQETNDMRGRLTLWLIDQNGRVVAERSYHNRIVKTGRLLVAQMFGGVSDGTQLSAISHIAVGTGGDKADDKQTALVKERGPRRPLDKPTYSDLTDRDTQRVKVNLTATFDYNDANGSDPLQEAGLFTAATGGIMYNRVTFEPVTKSNSFKLTLLWEVVF